MFSKVDLKMNVIGSWRRYYSTLVVFVKQYRIQIASRPPAKPSKGAIDECFRKLI